VSSAIRRFRLAFSTSTRVFLPQGQGFSIFRGDFPVQRVVLKLQVVACCSYLRAIAMGSPSIAPEFQYACRALRL